MPCNVPRNVLGQKLLRSPAAAPHQGTSPSTLGYNNEPPDKLLIHPVPILNGNRCLSALNGSSPKREQTSHITAARHGLRSQLGFQTTSVF